MREIQDIKHKLKTDKYSAVTVENGNDVPFRNYTYSDIVASHKSVDDFFDFLIKNYPNATVHERRQNGKSEYKSGKVTINYKSIRSFSLSSAPEVHYAVPQPQSLGTPSFGLAMPEIIRLNVDRENKVRLEMENEFLKKENERLKAVEDEYKEFKLSTKYSDSKSQQTSELVSGVLGSAMPIIEKITERLMMPKTGLAQPQLPQDQFIQEYMALDESSKNLFRNAMYFSKTSDEFANAFFDLINTHLNKQPNGTEN